MDADAITKIELKEEDLYPVIQRFLEKELGYYPVKIAPSLKIRKFIPDVTGIKGKRVITVEVKLDFNEMSMMGAITQAKVYSMGSTHAYIAFPSVVWISGDEHLRNLCTDLCVRKRRNSNFLTSISVILIIIPAGSHMNHNSEVLRQPPEELCALGCYLYNQLVPFFLLSCELKLDKYPRHFLYSSKGTYTFRDTIGETVRSPVWMKIEWGMLVYT